MGQLLGHSGADVPGGDRAVVPGTEKTEEMSMCCCCIKEQGGTTETLRGRVQKVCRKLTAFLC